MNTEVREPWHNVHQHINIGPYVTERWADVEAKGYWARAIECRVEGFPQWPPEAEAILERWDRATDTAIYRSWRDTVIVKHLRRAHVELGVNEGRKDFYDRFVEEVRLLQTLMPTRLINPLLDFGYVTLDRGAINYRKSANFKEFESSASEACEKQWFPILVLGRLPMVASIYRMLAIPVMNSDVAARPPLIHKLQIARAFLEFLSLSHEKNIYYMDHKLEHTYWINGGGVPILAMIDFNSCTRASGDFDRHAEEDLVNAFAAVLYPLFTGITIDNKLIGPRNVTDSGAVPRLDEGSGLDPRDGLIKVYGQEQRVPELRHEAIRLFLTWGVSRSSTDGGAVSRERLGARLANVLGLNPDELGGQVGAAKASVHAATALLRQLESEVGHWPRVYEVTAAADEAHRSLAHALRVCEEASESIPAGILRDEVVRLEEALSRMWKARCLSTEFGRAD
jgi:hypothetical protein